MIAGRGAKRKRRAAKERVCSFRRPLGTIGIRRTRAPSDWLLKSVQRARGPGCGATDDGPRAFQAILSKWQYTVGLWKYIAAAISQREGPQPVLAHQHRPWCAARRSGSDLPSSRAPLSGRRAAPERPERSEFRTVGENIVHLARGFDRQPPTSRSCRDGGRTCDRAA